MNRCGDYCMVDDSEIELLKRRRLLEMRRRLLLERAEAMKEEEESEKEEGEEDLRLHPLSKKRQPPRDYCRR